MKRLIVIAVALLLLSCSGGGGGTTSPSDPLLSSFSISPATGVGGTTATFLLEFVYTSTNGLSTATYTDADGDALVVYAAACIAGTFSCTVSVTVVLDVKKRTSAVTLFVVDVKGNVSNILSTNFVTT